VPARKAVEGNRAINRIGHVATMSFCPLAASDFARSFGQIPQEYSPQSGLIFIAGEQNSYSGNTPSPIFRAGSRRSAKSAGSIGLATGGPECGQGKQGACKREEGGLYRKGTPVPVVARTGAGTARLTPLCTAAIRVYDSGPDQEHRWSGSTLISVDAIER
jgi:hypothetical protein